MTLPQPGGRLISRIDLAFSRLTKRFKTAPVAPQFRVPGGLSTLIQPVTLIDDLLRTPDMLDGAYDISAASWVTIYTPAKGKRGRVLAVGKGSSVGNAYWRIWYSDANPRGFFPLTIPSGTATTVIFPQPIPVPYTWALQAISGNVADTAVTLEYLIEEEDDYV